MAWHADDPDPDYMLQMNAELRRAFDQRFTAHDIGWVFPAMAAHEQMAREGGLDELADRIRGARKVLEDSCEWGFGPAQSRALGGWHMAGRYGVMVITSTRPDYVLQIYRPEGDELKTTHWESGPRFVPLYRKGIEAINNQKETTNGS